MTLRSMIVLVLLVMGLGADDCAAQSASFKVKLNAVRPPESCSVTMPSLIVFNDMHIPWPGEGPVQYTEAVTATVSYTNTTSITASINSPSFNQNNGNITGSISVTPSSQTVTGSGTQNTLALTVSATATVKEATTPGTYTTQNKKLTVTCTN